MVYSELHMNLTIVRASVPLIALNLVIIGYELILGG